MCQYGVDIATDGTYPIGVHKDNTFTVVSGKVVVSYTDMGPDGQLR